MDNIQQQRYDEEVEIDLVELFHVIVDKLWIIILALVVCALLAFGYTKLFVTPQYQSTTSIYVLARQNDQTVTSSDLSASSQLTNDYTQLIKSRSVAEAVIAKLKLDLTPEQLIKKVSVNVVSSSRVISISVLDPDPRMAQRIADAVRNAAADTIKSVMNSEAVNVVDTANLPRNKYSPSVKRNVTIAGLLGAVLATGVILLIHFMDDTIKTSEDVEKYLGLSTLGSIPITKSNEQPKGKKTKKKKATGIKKATGGKK